MKLNVPVETRKHREGQEREVSQEEPREESAKVGEHVEGHHHGGEVDEGGGLPVRAHPLAHATETSSDKHLKINNEITQNINLSICPMSFFLKVFHNSNTKTIKRDVWHIFRVQFEDVKQNLLHTHTKSLSERKKAPTRKKKDREKKYK